MSASDITPAGLLIGFAIFVALIALVWAAVAWRRRPKGWAQSRRDEDPVIDLAYLERAIQADEEAAARRTAERRPLLSQEPDAQPDRSHRLPTDDR